MDKGQEQWEKLINLPQEYEHNPSIAQRAIETIAQKQATAQAPKKSWFARQWKGLVAGVAAVALAVGIGIPLYNKLSAPQVVYYETNEISYAAVEDTASYIAEKGIKVRYFDATAKVKTEVATITASGELAFIKQETLHVGLNGADKVNFIAVVKKKAEFPFYDTYKVLNSSVTVKGSEIHYEVNENAQAQGSKVLAKFTYEKVDYYLDIVTKGDGLTQLETYVNMLLA